MKTRTIIGLLVLACGALFVVVIGSCVGFAVLSLRNMDAAISPTVDELFAAIESDTFGDTYETHTSSEFHKTVTKAQYLEIGKTIHTRLGALKSKSLRQFNIRQVNASSFADLVYNASFEKGTGTIHARLKKEGDRWLVVGFHVNSPEFAKDIATAKCPHCDAPHASSARFCPSCGKPLTAERPANREKDAEVCDS